MKALVLSGGSGTRPRPRPSAGSCAAPAGQSAPAAGRPVLFDVLEGIADTGILDVGIVLGEGAEEIRAAVGDGTRFGVSVTYLPQHRPPDPARSLRSARDWLGEDDFVTYPGDTFVPGGIGEHLEEFRTHRPAAQAVPDHPGVYFFTEAVHRAVESATPTGGGPGASGAAGFGDLLRWLADQGLEVATGAPATGADDTRTDTSTDTRTDTFSATVTDTAVDHGRPRTCS
ncbi:sugar phosphate nucleotidyltransferase [Streptomyces sp. Isolate_45]|uniref:sugar phosphate nucleotidyltransferase n=1 Tax=Streptomyces sp. Isolate_45 TaxID=2950111 RepID=UPI002481ABB6|nr:sugar phosphate nucleotidyltransferase [Streptomyces sp. Isolate_45]MDA5285459.1 NTP transferase domain-containing protein [Streptomyces sp. Isolate_45]